MDTSASNDKTVYILDSYGLIYRSYFAFISRPLTNDRGENVSAIFGFFRNLLNILKADRPAFMAAAFDSRVPTFRHEMYDQYKANRDKTPDDLHAQVPVIEEILTALGIPVLRMDGFEADDIIATVAARCETEGRPCRILSGDKDLMQLVTATTKQMKPDKAGGWATVGSEGVAEEWGVGPDKMLDLLSLTGDTADNVPGVHGIGDKTAAKLLNQYGSLDAIYADAANIKGAMGEKLRNGRDMAYFSKSLIALRSDVPVDIDFASFDACVLNYNAAAELLKTHGVYAVAKSYAEKALDPCGDGGACFVGTPQSATSSSSALSFQKAGTAGTSSLTSTARPASELSSAPGDGSLVQGEPGDGSLVIRKNEGNYRAITDLADLHAFIDEALAAGTAAFDTETDGLNPLTAHMAGLSLSYKAGEGVYVPLRVTDMLLAGDMVSEKDALAELERLFSSPSMTLILHNAKFDLEVLYAAGLDCIHSPEHKAAPGCLKATLADTMVAGWLLQPDRTEGAGRGSYSLEKLAETKLGLSGTEYDDIVPKGKTFMDLPVETAYPYAAEDADFTLQLWQYFKPSLEKAGLMTLFTSLEMPVLPVLADMEVTGIRLEKSALASYKEELTANLATIEKDIYALAGHEFNIASPKQLGTVLFEELQLPHGKKTKSGYSTDTSVLEELQQLHPVPAKILEYRGMAKLLSTYVETLPDLADKNGRIHTSFIQTGTATGRLSSRDPNLQNIPVRDEAGRRIRSAFQAPEGRSLVSADYSQIELVVLAHLSGDRNMCAAFNEGRDVHRATAALIFGVPEDQVQADQRRTAKTINFGVMYGMSAFRLSNELDIPRARAQEFITQYFTTYAGINAFMDETVRKAEETGYVETIQGRRRTIQAINSGNKMEKSAAERVAVNTPIQGSAADIVKKAMLSVYDALSEAFPTARMLLQVHDELIVECDAADAPKVADLMKSTMEGVIKLNVPLRASVEYGQNWGEFH